jgi:hypothetical protein
MNEEKKEYVVVDNVQTTVREIMADEHINQSRLAERLGCARQNIHKQLTFNMFCSSFTKMVDALGYEVVVRKK